MIGFYLFSTRYLGWWSPSEMLFDPNVLATYVPWFSPIAQSLNAGFIEECLFRAIPLAGAVYRNYFGIKKLVDSCSIYFQAVVFGAAHANYAMSHHMHDLLNYSFHHSFGVQFIYGLVCSPTLLHTLFMILFGFHCPFLYPKHHMHSLTK